MRRPHPALRVVTVSILCILPAACVKKSTHEGALSDLARARDDIGSLEERVARLEAEQEELGAEKASVEAALADSIARIDQLETARDDLDQEVIRLRTLLAQRGQDYETLQRRLASLQAVEREVRDRNAIYEDVIGRFRSLMDGGQLSVEIQRGRLVILLPQDVLFESGSARLGREGQAVITEVASVLAEFPDRRFQVEGHTDNVPISTAQFPSNWELSSARSLAVVRLLASSGVTPENISGAAYGEYQPVASNEDREARRQNRRIEIVMLPNLDVIADTQVPVGR